jgi:UDP-N-acetylglucosamine 2-epimerase (non-hydrolysing)
MKPILLVVGTRPEAIKIIPVYKALKQRGIPTLLCSTAQHNELLTCVLHIFEVKPDYNLHIMKPRQSLFYITKTILHHMEDLLKKIDPALVLVQGDTTTAMTSSLAAFYTQIKIGHIEAGLRTYNLTSPFPEEMNRSFISLIASYHFAPTKTAYAQLIREGAAPHSVYYTGNTIVDALTTIRTSITTGHSKISSYIQNYVQSCASSDYKIAILTMHRRESLAGGIERIMQCLKTLLTQHPDLSIIYPTHPNPSIQNLIQTHLGGHQRINICPPLPYPDFVYILTHCTLVITDSGGVQEEAITLGKPTLILRENTERPEGIETCLATLVGTDPYKIAEAVARAMRHPTTNTTHCIYGDGTAANKIADIIQKHVVENNNIQSNISTAFQQSTL